MTPAVLEPGLLSAVTPVLIGHEGERLKVYGDIYGIPTVGVGFNLMRSDAASRCKQCGANYQRLLGGLDQLTQEQSRYLFQQDVIGTIEWLTKLFSSFWSYTQPRQIALVDMGFNMGETKFRGFRKMISCIIAGDWTGAADQALHSQWASEVAGRAEHDAGLMRAG
jgi:GH24 family phage-related lysozyme (muramidase)